MSVTAFNLMRRRQEALKDKVKKIDYSEHTNAELKKILDDKNIEYNTRATKKELIELVEVN